MPKPRAAFEIGGQRIAPGERMTVDLPISILSNHTPITLPVHVVHGRQDGPVFFVSAVVHGDEIIGVEIIRRILRVPSLNRLRGTLLAIPIVNAYGFISHSRYLPDRRDLNRVFPGIAGGSLAARLAHLFTHSILEPSDYGIDLHSAGLHRTNLPQIRIAPGDPRTRELADAFGAPVVIESSLRPGSLRQTAADEGVPVLLYEGGEALRFDEFAIRAGMKGVLRVLKHLGMIRGRRVSDRTARPVHSSRSSWLRAPEGGILRAFRSIGDSVEDGELLGVISDPFGEVDAEVRAKGAGLVVGRTNLPVVNQGDALFHVATVSRPVAAGVGVGELQEELRTDPLFDEDEIL